MVDALREGDPGAFAQVYELYRARLHTFLLRLTRDEQLSRDLAQEVWLRLASNARKLAPASDVGAWLYTVARNLYRSQRRWALLDRERLAEWGLTKRSDSLATPLVEAAAHEQSLKLERAIAQLPLPYREVVLLLSSEGFDQAEVATMLKLDPAAVRKRLSRARAMLREALESPADGGPR